MMTFTLKCRVWNVYWSAVIQKVADFMKELRWNDMYYHLANGFH
jgi:hypothetical protein